MKPLNRQINDVALEGAEVYGPEAVDERFAVVADELQHLTGLYRSHYGWRDAYYGLSGMWHGACLVFVDEVTIGGLPLAQDAHLSFQTVDGAVDVGLALLATGIADGEACREVVGAVNHYVVAADELCGILLGEQTLVRLHLDITIAVEQPVLGTLYLGLPHLLFGVYHLPMEVGDAHHVVVDQAEGADAGSGEVGGDG